MITVESRKARKKAKRQVRLRLRDMGINMREIEVKVKEEFLSGNISCSFHYTTIKRALDPETYYWNPELISLAKKMIEEKKEGQKDAEKQLSTL